MRLDGHDHHASEGLHDIESALHDIQRHLPSGTRLKACVACAPLSPLTSPRLPLKSSGWTRTCRSGLI
ncbi:DUF6304 family protein [Streptomyces acidiscabies]|uniref:DUF6304 family protein n=1 Tax=Streptomyces acidiscabies TaxID=42234 RepID=UPI0035A22E30